MNTSQITNNFIHFIDDNSFPLMINNTSKTKHLKEIYKKINTSIRNTSNIAYDETPLPISNIINKSTMNGIPLPIQQDIEINCRYGCTLQVTVQSYIIVIHIVSVKPLTIIEKKNIIHKMVAWLDFIIPYSVKECISNGTMKKRNYLNRTIRKNKVFPNPIPNPNPQICVTMYFSNLCKEMPINNIISPINSNTAYTYSCITGTTNTQIPTIYIYRKEEWFKVFIHETFHCFGLDFSGLCQENLDNLNYRLLREFPFTNATDIDCKIYETYTETWADILHTIFYTLFVNNNSSIKDFYKNIQIESMYSVFQCCKILENSKLDYTLLRSSYLPTMNYRENTAVLSYYVFKSFLLCNYSQFIDFCYTIQNKKSNNPFQCNTMKQAQRFTAFILQQYTQCRIIPNTFQTYALLYKNNENIIPHSIQKSLRMTILQMENGKNE